MPLVFVKPLTPELEKIVARLRDRSKEGQMFEFESIQEMARFVSRTGGGFIYLRIPSTKDAHVVLNLFKIVHQSIRRGSMKILVSTPIKSPGLVAELMKSGAQEVLTEPVQERATQFKIDRILQTLAAKIKSDQKNGDVARKSHEKTKASTQGKQAQSTEVKFVDPINLKTECWLTKNGGARTVMGRWSVQLLGPSPTKGKWVLLSGGTEAYKWLPALGEKDPFVKDKGLWVFEGNRPEFINNTKMWNFAAKNPRLSFQFIEKDGARGAVVYKVKTGESALEIAKDSPAGLALLPLILESLEEVLTLKEGEEKAQELETPEDQKSGDRTSDGRVGQELSVESAADDDPEHPGAFAGKTRKETDDLPEGEHDKERSSLGDAPASDGLDRGARKRHGDLTESLESPMEAARRKRKAAQERARSDEDSGTVDEERKGGRSRSKDSKKTKARSDLSTEGDANEADANEADEGEDNGSTDDLLSRYGSKKRKARALKATQESDREDGDTAEDERQDTNEKASAEQRSGKKTRRDAGASEAETPEGSAPARAGPGVKKNTRKPGGLGQVASGSRKSKDARTDASDEEQEESAETENDAVDPKGAQARAARKKAERLKKHGAGPASKTADKQESEGAEEVDDDPDLDQDSADPKREKKSAQKNAERKSRTQKLREEREKKPQDKNKTGSKKSKHPRAGTDSKPPGAAGRKSLIAALKERIERKPDNVPTPVVEGLTRASSSLKNLMLLHPEDANKSISELSALPPGPRLTVLGLAFLLSEVNIRKDITPQDKVTKFCMLFSASCAGIPIEVWRKDVNGQLQSVAKSHKRNDFQDKAAQDCAAGAKNITTAVGDFVVAAAVPGMPAPQAAWVMAWGSDAKTIPVDYLEQVAALFRWLLSDPELKVVPLSDSDVSTLAA